MSPPTPTNRGSRPANVVAQALVSYLRQEHRAIEQVLTSLDHYVDRLEWGQLPDPQELGCIVKFLREFLDLGHRAKEDRYVLPLLLEHGLLSRPTFVELRAAHDAELALMRRLQQLTFSACGWSDQDQLRIIELGRRVTAFNRDHLHREEEVLDRLVAGSLPIDAGKELLARLERFDQRWDQHGQRSWLLALARNLGT